MTAIIPKPLLINYIQINHSPEKQIIVNKKDSLEIFPAKQIIYWIKYQKKGGSETEHDHNTLMQAITATPGSVKISLKGPVGNIHHSIMDNPFLGLNLPARFRKKISYAKPCILSGFASDRYYESDYSRDYNSFKQLSNPR